MNSEKIKEIWKENAVKKIDNYTDSEITSIVLKTARKAMNRSYPGIIFWSLLILSCLLGVWVMMKYSSPQLQTYGYVLTAVIMLMLGGAVCISEWGRRKVQRYSFDMPLKEWVELRIQYFDKGIKRSGKWFWRFGLGITVLLLFCLIYIFTEGFSFKILLVQLFSGLTALFIAGTIANRISMKRMIETRQQLQELYNQLQDSEELSK
ncbi:MAG: hypothetical protein LBF62_08590 [Tannerellaceae bacterium]|jgi:peptidoglycan/LPS O-acetylase OafA/YrhL|nr:hypothetical protein [Tannerellaceae bacterium]